MFYVWQRSEIKSNYSAFEKYYKILFSKNNLLSWMDAIASCESYDMVLPSFSTKTQVRKLLSFIQNKYRFQPITMFIGVLNYVSVTMSIYIIYSFLNRLLNIVMILMSL